MNKSKLRTEYEARFGVVVGYFKLYDAEGNVIYREAATGYWWKEEYDAEGNSIYREDADGYCLKREYDAEGNVIYCETSDDGVEITTGESNEQD
tara:strand:- start:20 stop:301 length:282 start_codon:yes stop_codon:yes gene_type:complete